MNTLGSDEAPLSSRGAEGDEDLRSTIVVRSREPRARSLAAARDDTSRGSSPCSNQFQLTATSSERCRARLNHEAQMDFVLTLHSHLPYVLNHGRWPHGSDWITEAAIDTYLPLIESLRALDADGIAAPVTIGFTPVLANQLASDAFRERARAVLRAAPGALRRGAGVARSSRRHAPHPARGLLARAAHSAARAVPRHRRRHHRGRFATSRRAGSSRSSDRPRRTGFCRCSRATRASSCSSTSAGAEHKRLFGRAPRGCWVPECAYRPRGPWKPLPNAPDTGPRPGIEEYLARRRLSLLLRRRAHGARGEPARAVRAGRRERGGARRVAGRAMGSDAHAVSRIPRGVRVHAADRRRVHARSRVVGAGVEPASGLSRRRPVSRVPQDPLARRPQAVARDRQRRRPRQKEPYDPPTASAIDVRARRALREPARRRSRAAHPCTGAASSSRRSTRSCSATGGTRDRSSSANVYRALRGAAGREAGHRVGSTSARTRRAHGSAARARDRGARTATTACGSTPGRRGRGRRSGSWRSGSGRWRARRSSCHRRTMRSPRPRASCCSCSRRTGSSSSRPARSTDYAIRRFNGHADACDRLLTAIRDGLGVRRPDECHEPRRRAARAGRSVPEHSAIPCAPILAGNRR